MLSLPKLSLTPPKPPPTPAATPAAIKSDEKQPLNYGLLSILLFYIFVCCSVQTGLTTYIPLYYVNYWADNTTYSSYLVAIFLMTGSVGTDLGGLRSDNSGRKSIILFSLIALVPLVSALNRQHDRWSGWCRTYFILCHNHHSRTRNDGWARGYDFRTDYWL
jgi:nitrate/nitrite transporter NarK